jgi:hypothetical protein
MASAADSGIPHVIILFESEGRDFSDIPTL